VLHSSAARLQSNPVGLSGRGAAEDQESLVQGFL
jgi:hypothetical protein